MPAYTTDTTETAGRRQIVVAVLFFLLSVITLFLPAGAQQDVAAAFRVTLLRPFLITQEELARARMRAQAADRLRATVDSLVAVTATAGTLEEENRRLRGLLSLRQRLGPDYVPAALIRPGTAGSESMFLVDRGSEQGVVANAPVITRGGLVGVVREVGVDSSIGMDWTHPDFRASAMSRDGTVYGMVESRRGDFREEDRLMLNGTAFHSSLEEGTVVVTSGLGGVLPRGIPVGRVTGVAEADAGWRKSYWLEPFVKPGSVTHVLVATSRPGDAADSLPAGILASAWPADSIVTLEELTERERARRDSLEALGDSVAILRGILRDRHVQDSLRAVQAADSVRSPLPRPAPPTGPPSRGGEGETVRSGGAAGAGRDTSGAVRDASGAARDATGTGRDTSRVRGGRG